MNFMELMKPCDGFAHVVARYDTMSIAAKRRHNFQVLDKMLKDVSGIKQLKKIGATDIPHNYPVTVENRLRRQKCPAYGVVLPLDCTSSRREMV